MNDHPPATILDGEQLRPAPPRLGAAQPEVGVYGTAGTAIGFDDAMLGRHILFLGGIGTGKTVGMSALVRSIRASAQPSDVLVFFDTKGDYLDRFFQPGDAVLSLDGAHAAAARWNLFSDFDPVDSKNFVDNVNEVAATLFAGVETSAGADNAIWPMMARDLFAAIVIGLARNAANEGLTLSNLDVRAIADTMTLAEIHELLWPHEDLRGVLQYVAKEGSNATVSVMIFLQQALRSLFVGSFRESGDFSVRSFVQEKGGRALFVEYDVANGSSVAPLYRTLLDVALKESLGRQRAAGRVWFILDEFALLPKLTHLEPGLNFGRSLGLRFVVGTQNVGQPKMVYGNEGGNSVLSAFGTVFAFRLYDHASRQFIRERFGSNRRVVRYESVLKTRGIVEDRIDGSVIEDWDISGLQVGQTVVSLPDGPPYLFTFQFEG